MHLNAYAPCPCGSGKKLKFCCNDLAGEIEKLQKMVASDQPRAALQRVQQLLEKQPQRTSLLDLCVTLQLQLNEFDEAAKTNARLLEFAPDAPGPYAYAALLAIDRRETIQAVALMQDSLERVTETIPEAVVDALGYVGHALLITGDVVAGRGHLSLYAAIAPSDENRGVELLLRQNLEGSLPLLLREQLQVTPPPANEPKKKLFSEAVRLAQRGLWRRAAGEFRKLLSEKNPQHEVVYNLAVLLGWLGDRGAFVEGMRRYSNLDVPLNRAVVAEGLSQLTRDEKDEASASTLRLIFKVVDADELGLKFAADKRVEPYSLDEDESSNDDTSPRSSFILLDRPPGSDGNEVTCDNASNVVAFLSLYGKRTDRDAFLMVTTDENAQFTDTLQLLSEIGAPWLGPEESREIAAQRPLSAEALSWRWRLPENTSLEHRRALISQNRRRAILERWTKAPQAALDGLSPFEAVGRQEYRIPLLACVLILEQGAALDEDDLFHELRRLLRLPPAEPIAANEYAIDELPMIYVGRYDLASLDDAQLAQLLDRAIMIGAKRPIVAIAEEIVARDRDDNATETAWRQLVRQHPVYSAAIAWADKAADRARQRNQSAAEWILHKLHAALDHRDAQTLRDALRTLQRDHSHEPGVVQAVLQLLHAYGLAPPENLPRENALPAPDATQRRLANELWTPGSNDAPAPVGSKPVIWTP